jgi:hypothetical protein
MRTSRESSPAERVTLLRDGRRAAYLAFAWVLAFLAWHVVWALTGLETPSASHHGGTTRVLIQVSSVAVVLLVAAGTVLPLALAQAWGRHVPRWMLLAATWAGCALLSARGLAGIGDDLVRLTGVLPGGLTGLTTAQVIGTAHPSTWAVVASGATDVLFTAGGLAFGTAAVAYRRARPPGQAPDQRWIRAT